MLATRLLPGALALLLLACSACSGDRAGRLQRTLTAEATLTPSADGDSVTGQGVITFVNPPEVGEVIDVTIRGISARIEAIQPVFTLDDSDPISLSPGEMRQVRFHFEGQDTDPLVKKQPWELACRSPLGATPETFWVDVSTFDSWSERVDGDGYVGAAHEGTLTRGPTSDPRPTAELGAAWSKPIGGDVDALAFDAAGHLLVGGRGFVDLGLPAQTNVLATLDGAGNVIDTLPLPAIPSAFSLLVDGPTMLVVGSIKDSILLGDQVLTAPAGHQGFYVARLDPAGKVLWVEPFSAETDLYLGPITVDPAGNLRIVGGYYGPSPFDLGGGPLSGEAVRGGFLLRLDPSGAFLDARRFDGVWSTASAAADPSGALVVTGTLSGTVDLGGGPLVGAYDNHPFIARYDASGAHVWSHLLDGYAAPLAAFGPSGDLVVVQSESVSLLDAAGATVWEKPFGPSPDSLVVDDLGRIFVTGSFTGEPSVQGLPLAAGGDQVLYLVELDAGGTAVRAEPFGCGGGRARLHRQPGIPGVALATPFRGFASLDQGPFEATGNFDLLVAMLGL